ncbi:ABC transporter substrate-binding protein [Vibrio rumoiensis]|uniref:Iron-hydroxamate ABC transporter substrate-binding protein n=1 Tax=Vibrio rumoiensis 1S-45 TaxID=1188252 RepID=A0A1E5DZY2_9VIBR|nr:iron-siderophore ABC transporter substrate-binding protein [Vibrio rumoiensis]OEF23663.1 iron-hydroxamate ABC transporter substrate-binding protein [Vibrio rumoiensis 1S-45]
MNNIIRAIGSIWIALLSLPSQAAITVTDSLGQHQLPETPKRIVALNWDLAEQLIELDVVPVGVPNIKDYTTWVVQPAMPASVEDLGTRAEPNMEKLAALKPDLILAASPQKDLIPRLQTIAPVLYYQTYNAEQNSAQAAIENFKHIAQVVGKTPLAEQKLNQMQQRFSELKGQLESAFNGSMPSVAAMRFANQTTVYLYAQNSTTDYVLHQLGLTTALPQPAKEWGIVQKRLTDLQHVKDGYVIYFGPFTQQQSEQLNKSMLWNAMPFVRNGHVNQADTVWNYGGAMSMEYIAESITKSLLEIKPKS